MVVSDTSSSSLSTRPRINRLEPCYFNLATNDLMKEGLKGIRVLDLGCGPVFRDLRILDQLGATELVGVDTFERSAFGENPGRIEYLRTDIDESSLPMADMSFDLVVMDNVVEHLYNPLSVLAECRRVLKSKGTLVLLTPNQARLKNRVKLFIGGSIYYPLEYWIHPERESVRRRGRLVFGGHIREYTTNEIRKMVLTAGFRVRSTTMLRAIAASSLDSSKVAGDADAIEGRLNSKAVLLIYNILESIFPPWRTMISITATKD